MKFATRQDFDAYAAKYPDRIKGEEFLEGVREHAEGSWVSIKADEDTGRECVLAYNEGGHNCTLVDLLDLVEWIKANRPELIKEN